MDAEEWGPCWKWEKLVGTLTWIMSGQFGRNFVGPFYLSWCEMFQQYIKLKSVKVSTF